MLPSVIGAEAPADELNDTLVAHVAEIIGGLGGLLPGWDTRGRPMTTIEREAPHWGSTLKSMASAFHTIHKLVHEPNKRKR